MSAELIAALAGVLAVFISIIVFVYQSKQNYTQNVFQMMNLFHKLLQSATFLTQKTVKDEKIDIERSGYKMLKFFLLHIQHGTLGEQNENKEEMVLKLANEAEDKDKFWIERLKVSTEFCMNAVGSRIVSLVKQALLVEKYMKYGFRGMFQSSFFNTQFFKIKDNDVNEMPRTFTRDYRTLVEYFRTTIFLEFRLIVLLLYIQSPDNEDYKIFLKKGSIGSITFDECQYFLIDDENKGLYPYHQLIKSKIKKALEELNK